MTALVYQQATGALLDANTGHAIGIGYSGHGRGVNNPDAQRIPDVGPIPCGHWRLGAPESPESHRGPLSFPLTALAGSESFGRSGFFIHGDNPALNHTASLGCIIFNHAIRAELAERFVGQVLTVVSGRAPAPINPS